MGGESHEDLERGEDRERVCFCDAVKAYRVKVLSALLGWHI